jgi:hypothetical protein
VFPAQNSVTNLILPERSPFERIFQPYVVEVLLAQAVPTATFLGTDMEVNQTGACTYDQFGYFTAANLAFPALNQQRQMAMPAVKVSDEFILGNADGRFGGKYIQVGTQHEVASFFPPMDMQFYGSLFYQRFIAMGTVSLKEGTRFHDLNLLLLFIERFLFGQGSVHIFHKRPSHITFIDIKLFQCKREIDEFDKMVLTANAGADADGSP